MHYVIDPLSPNPVMRDTSCADYILFKTKIKTDPVLEEEKKSRAGPRQNVEQ